MIDTTKLELFHQVTGIPLTLCGPDGMAWFEIGCFQPNPAWGHLQKIITKLPQACITTTPSNLYYGMLRCADQTVLLGPTMPFDCTPKQLVEILSELEQSSSRSDELLKWLQQVPCYTDRRLRSAIEMLQYLLFGKLTSKVISISTEPSDETTQMHDEPQGMSISFIPNSENTVERFILGCVEYGKTEELEHALDLMLLSGNAGAPDFNLDVDLTYQNIFVLSTSLASRSAVQGGMAYSVCNGLSIKYLSKVKSIRNQVDFGMIFRQMLLEFTRAVARCRMIKTDSILVKHLCKDVQTNIFDKLSVKDIAIRLNRSSEYLCRHFKQKTGMTIIEYIQREKVVECKRMLTTTDLSLSEIASQLAFSSQSYMHAVFLKHTGITPTAYRNANRYASN